MSDFTDAWTTFTRTGFLWATTPKLVIPILLGLSTLAVVPRIPSPAKLLGRVMALLLGGYLLLATPLVANFLVAGLTCPLSPETNDPADAIVVLGRGNELGYNRYDMAIQLWHQGRVPKVFVTNLGRFQYMTKRFEEEDLPTQVLNGSICARTTFEEATSTSTILGHKQVKKIILITDPAHMWRAALTFRQLGFIVVPNIAPYPSDFSSLDESVVALRQYLGLLAYFALGRLEGGLSKTSPNPSLRSLDCMAAQLDD